MLPIMKVQFHSLNHNIFIFNDVMYLPYIFLFLGENYCPLVINVTVNNDLDPENVSSLNHLRAVPPGLRYLGFWDLNRRLLL